VLMDVEMPVADGYTATRAIRQYEQESGATPTPVLALTAHAFADMAAKASEAGFTAHLTKPIRKATLLAALAQHATPGATAPDEPIRVKVEQDMEDVVPAYLEKRRKDVSTYRQALASRDFETLRMLGHKLKGTGGGYGFAMLTELGAAIEQSAVREDAGAVGSKVDELARYLERVQLE